MLSLYQAWKRIDAAKEELRNLSKEWKWAEQKLRLAGFGTPKFIIESVLKNKSYEPYVPLGSIRRNKVKDFSELSLEIDNDLAMFEEENQQFLQLGGEKIYISLILQKIL